MKTHKTGTVMMARLPFNIGNMLRVPSLRRQFLQAVQALAAELPAPDALGHAYKICEAWQRRLEQALQTEIPDWVVLAAFRPTLDFKPSPDVLDDLKGTGRLSQAPPADGVLTTLDECRQAYQYYLGAEQNLFSGKFILQGAAAQDWFLRRVKQCEAVFGGQAGNIAWLWRCLGADTRLYTPYWSSRLADLPATQPAVERIQLLALKNGIGEFKCYRDMPANAHAPTAGSLTIVKDGRRLIYMLPGLQALESSNRELPAWEQVQFFYQGQALLERPLRRAAGDLTWPPYHSSANGRLIPI